jgi:8-amino-7-oxononanoate synthase
MPDLSQWLTERLAEVDAANLARTLRVLESPQLPVVRHHGRDLINFSSNDYLGLATHAAVKQAALGAIETWGVGSGASRLISGTQAPHDQLEQELAAFKKTDAALVFSTGFAAAMGTIPAIVGAGDVVILDKLSHACLVDGARMSGAIIRVFPHNNLDRLNDHLRWARTKFPDGNILVVTESVFSMDGDRAPLREIVELKNQSGAWLLLDEAHATGVIGEQGRGAAFEGGVADQVDLHMGTLGKALGSSGGYICGSCKLIDWLINRARSFIFSTAPSASTASAASAALGVIQSTEGDVLRGLLWKHIRRVSPNAESGIVPVLIGDEGEAMMAAERLFDAGIWVPAVRFPTVPRGRARLRISLSAAHASGQVDRLMVGLSE